MSSIEIPFSTKILTSGFSRGVRVYQLYEPPLTHPLPMSVECNNTKYCNSTTNTTHACLIIQNFQQQKQIFQSKHIPFSNFCPFQSFLQNIITIYKITGNCSLKSFMTETNLYLRKKKL